MFNLPPFPSISSQASQPPAPSPQPPAPSPAQPLPSPTSCRSQPPDVARLLLYVLNKNNCFCCFSNDVASSQTHAQLNTRYSRQLFTQLCRLKLAHLACLSLSRAVLLCNVNSFLCIPQLLPFLYIFSYNTWFEIPGGDAAPSPNQADPVQPELRAPSSRFPPLSTVALKALPSCTTQCFSSLFF